MKTFSTTSLTPCFLRIHKARIGRHWVWPEHTNQDTEIVLIRKGQMRCDVDGIKFIASDGELYFVQPNQLHYEEIISEHLDIFTLRFNLLDSRNRPSCFIDTELASPPHLTRVGKYFEKLLEKILLLVWQDDPEGEEQICELIKDVAVRLKEQILADSKAASQQVYHNHHLVNQAVEFMKTNIHRTVSFDDLASHCCISKYYLAHRFKQMVGISPLRYFQSLKIDHAKRLLADDTLCIHEIARRTGFDDPFYFSRVFKRHAGVSPQAFRNRIQSTPL